ncbi:zinc-ribbon domain-containing protein [Archangium gephyra]|uniref:YIP1 family protein n=1 Tax=Archangium gephyra TaxID=48 RepID=UPI0035D4CEE5
MHLPCPHCQRPLIPGATSCPACGTSLLREVSPGSDEPTCAFHPQRVSLAICDRCGSFACAACLRLNSRDELVCQRCHALEQDEPLPWDQREELGTLTAWWKTVLHVMFHPDTFPTLRPEGSGGGSLLFALLSSLPGSFMMGLTYLGLVALLPSMFPEGTQAAGDLAALYGLFMFAFFMVVGPLASLASTVILAGLDHLVLSLGGVTRGFQVTLRAHALSQAPWVLGAVPCVGIYVAPFWALVARAFAYHGLHRTTWGVALAGTVLTPLLSCCMCGGAWLFMFNILGRLT